MANLENPEVGLERRYSVTRLTPSSTGKVHQSCEYFVLDLTHDPFARRAAQVYALIADENNQHQLARDLWAKIDQLEQEARHEEELRALRREADDDFFNE